MLIKTQGNLSLLMKAEKKRKELYFITYSKLKTLIKLADIKV